MPVTARLSKKFYDAIGEDLAQELVDWFNQVDATYRADLKELNELNFARFDAKLEQRVAQSDARLAQRMAELEAKLNQRMAELEAKFERRWGELDVKVEQSKVELRAEIRGLSREIDGHLGNLKAELIKWMFLFVVGTAVAVVGVMSRMMG